MEGVVANSTRDVEHEISWTRGRFAKATNVLCHVTCQVTSADRSIRTWQKLARVAWPLVQPSFFSFFFLILITPRPSLVSRVSTRIHEFSRDGGREFNTWYCKPASSDVARCAGCAILINRFALKRRPRDVLPFFFFFYKSSTKSELKIVERKITRRLRGIF